MTQRRVESYDEHRLVELARDGDRAAFGALVAMHQHEVFTLAVRLVRNPTLAADVAQEAFIRAYRSIQSFRGDAAFSTWLHRITVNTAWTQIDRAKRKRAAPLGEAPDVRDVSGDGDPETAVEAAVLRRRLVNAVEQLPDNQRVVVVLKDVHGWSHAEIAAELSITVTATKVRLHRAHQRLRSLLGGHE